MSQMEDCVGWICLLRFVGIQTVIVLIFLRKKINAGIKMKTLKIKTSFVSPEEPKAEVYTDGFNYMILIFISVENCL